MVLLIPQSIHGRGQIMTSLDQMAIIVMPRFAGRSSAGQVHARRCGWTARLLPRSSFSSSAGTPEAAGIHRCARDRACGAAEPSRLEQAVVI